MSPSETACDEDDFRRWRPLYHLLPTHGWLNDPCAPFYDSATQTYYIGFQWNPKGWDWGHISWGAATSEDLVNWTVSPVPSIEPLSEAGVFTGCMVPDTAIKSQRSKSGNTLNIFYTSAQRLPIHYTCEYNRGCEEIHTASSDDGGLTWTRDARNPVLPGPPEHLTVTGWRDPYIFTWESYDKVIGRPAGSGLYGVVAGGVKDDSPTIFLYDIDRDDLMRWTFLTTLIRPGLNSTADAQSDIGVNWEVANVMSLYDDENNAYQVVIIGVEGCEIDTTKPEPITREKRVGRAQKWICADLDTAAAASQDTAPSQLTYDFSGSLDWGIYYAGNSFWDPVSQTHIIHGWIMEEDLGADLRQRQGWSGMISLGRTLQMKTYRNVVDVPDNMPGFKKRYEKDGSVTLVTLVVVPEPRLSGLRARAMQSCLGKLPRELHRRGAATSLVRLTEGLPSLELDLSFEVYDEDGEVGIDLFHSTSRPSVSYLCSQYSPKADLDTYTSIIFKPAQGIIIVNRDHSCNQDKGILTETEVAPLSLLSRSDPTTGDVKRETLNVRIFFDVSVLEIFVNDRVAITTRVYPESGKCVGADAWGRRAEIVRCIGWELKTGTSQNEGVCR